MAPRSRRAYNPLMSKWKLSGAVALVLVVTVLAAYLYGRSETSDLRTELAASRLRVQLAEARGQLLDAQIALYMVNFGQASQHLTYARPSLAAAKITLTDAGKPELAAKIEAAEKELNAARELAAKLSQDANSRAGQAARLVGEVMQAGTRE